MSADEGAVPATTRIKPRAEACASCALTPEQREELTHPPLGPSGEMLVVNYRLTVFHIGAVDTREQKASIKMGIVLYWTDPRMIGWTSPLLPPTLWGPELYLKNAIGGTSIEYEQFVVTGVEDGRMKRIVNYEATIIAPMDLHCFPFDVQVISPEWVSISHWRQLDGSRYGSRPQGQSYSLQPVVDGGMEGDVLQMFFGGAIPEWRLEAGSSRMATAVNTAGFTAQTLTVRFYLSRRYAYYITKVITPLAVLAITNFLVFFIEPHLLADRIANTFTMFLAAYALLYVVGEHVPHVDFLTIVDRIILVTLAVLAFSAITSVVVWYIAVYIDGIGAGIVGARRGASTAADEEEEAMVDEDEEATGPYRFPSAYAIDIAMGGALLIAYLAYAIIAIVPNVWEQEYQRAHFEEDFAEGAPPSSDPELCFFRRFDSDASKHGARRMGAFRYHYEQRRSSTRARSRTRSTSATHGGVLGVIQAKVDRRASIFRQNTLGV